LKIILKIILILLLPLSVSAQQVTITGTVVDPHGVPFTNGRGRALLVPTNVAFTTGLTNPVPGSQSPVIIDGLDAFGHFSVNLTSTAAIDQQTSNPQWMFTFCSAPILQFGPICFTMAPLSLTSSQDISAQISATPPPILPLAAGGGSPGGIPIQTQVNNSGSFGGTPCESFTNITTGPENINCDWLPKGPNPYIDVRAFGVRPVDRSVAPAIPGVTANCVSGSPNVTISTASTFRNGDGVALYGCGSDTITAPAAPTVTPSLAAGLTGTQVDVAGLTGSTTYCYQLVARSLLGATNVSPETCTTTGPTSLGLQTNTITSVSLSNTLATYTTSSPHGLVVGAAVAISGVTIANPPPNLDPGINPFIGFFQVNTVPDNTHFTLALMTDSRAGGLTAGTGGTVNYWNCIKVKATETTNNYIYYVYGRVSGGTKTFLQAMWPQYPGLGTDPTYLVLDDFGSPVTATNLAPLYIPNTVPTTPTNGMLATTIVSGAGTTSLVLAANAGNTINGQTILVDDAVTFLNAVAYAQNSTAGTIGALLFPDIATTPWSPSVYIFNSPISIANVAIAQKGEVWMNEPITLNGNVLWYGEPSTHQNCPGFSFGCHSRVTMARASPAFHATQGNFVRNLDFEAGNANGVTFWIQESGGTPVTADFRDVDFDLNVGITYSNIGYLSRGNAGSMFGKNILVASSQNGNLIGTTPGMYFDNTGDPIVDGWNFSGVGIAYKPNQTGSLIKANNVYCQACYMPIFSIEGFPVGGGPTRVFVGGVTRDTFPGPYIPVVADISGQPMTVSISGAVPAQGVLVTGSFIPAIGQGAQVSVTSYNSSNSSTSQNLSSAKLDTIYVVNDGTFGQGSFIGVEAYKRSIQVGPGFSLFTTTVLFPAPTCPVSAGGSVPVGTFTYSYSPIYANGSEGQSSYVCSATTTTGNQTVTVSWSAVPGAVQYQIARNGREVLVSPSTGTTFVDTFNITTGPNVSQTAVGGPAGMQNGLVWGQKMLSQAYNGTQMADQFSGADASVKTNACIAAVISAGGGKCDASGLTGAQIISQEIDVGNHAQVPVTLILPEASTWTVTGITNGTSCAIKQFSQSSIIGPGTGGSGGMRIHGGLNTNNLDSLYCTEAAPTGNGSYIRAEGFQLYNPNTATMANGAMNVQAIFDDSDFHDIVVASYGTVGINVHGLVCCGATFTNVTSNGNFVAGSIPVKINIASTAVLPAFYNLSADHPGSGLNAIQISLTSHSGARFYNTYSEGNNDLTTANISVSAPSSQVEFYGTLCNDPNTSTAYCMDFVNNTHQMINVLGLSNAVGGSPNCINDHFAGKTYTCDSDNGTMPLYTAGSGFLGGVSTFAQLPSASLHTGEWRTITDSTAIASEGQNCAGAGTVIAAVFSNGTVWKCF